MTTYFARDITPNVTGSQADFAVSFPYLLDTHVEVLVRAEGTGWEDAVLQAEGVDYQWTSSSVIHFLPGHLPASGSEVMRKRSTPEGDLLTRLVGGSPLLAAQLNSTSVQLLYLNQEAADEAAYNVSLLSHQALRVSDAETISLVPSARAGKYLAFDASKNPIASSGTGVDAALRTDLAALSGGLLVGLQLGDQGIGRPLEDILREGLWLQPEMFAEGVGLGLDDTAALTKMTDEGVLRDELLVKLLPGKVYGTTNPYLFGNARVVILKGGEGTQLLNMRVDSGTHAFTTFSANYQPFHSPIPALPNGREVLTFGAGQGPNLSVNGTRIKSVAAGGSALQTFDGSPFPVTSGPIFIEGFQRYEGDTFPASPAYFEYADVVGLLAPDTAQVRFGTQNAYDERWPERIYTGNPAMSYGAPRVTGLNREDGQFRRFRWPRLLAISDIEMATQPGQSTITGEVTVNGAGSFGGADTVVLDRVKARRGTVSFARRVLMSRYRSDDNFELDKCIGSVESFDCDFAALIAGLGVHSYSDEGSRIYGDNAVAPIELRQFKKTWFGGKDAFGSGAVIGDSVYGSRRTVVEDIQVRATEGTLTELIADTAYVSDSNVVVVDGNTIKWTRANWNGAFYFKCLRLGKVFTNAAGLPLFRCDTMGYCTGDQTTGDVFIDGAFLNGGFASGATLRMALHDEVSIDRVTVEGPLAETVKTAHIAWVLSKDVTRGTAFPVAPVSGQRFFRTDRGVEYFWNGVRWLSTNTVEIFLASDTAASPVVGGNHWLRGPNPHVGTALWAETFRVSALTDLATSNINYRTWTLKPQNSNTTLSNTLTTQNDAQYVWTGKSAALGVIIPSTDVTFEVYGSPTGAPSSFAHAVIIARLIG